MMTLVLVQCLIADVTHCRTLKFPIGGDHKECMYAGELKVNEIGKQYNNLWFNRKWDCQFIDDSGKDL